VAESRDFGIGKSSGIPGFGIPGLQSLVTTSVSFIVTVLTLTQRETAVGLYSKIGSN